MEATKVKGKSLPLLAGLVVVVLLVLVAITGSWYQVDQGERAVVLRNGRLVDVAEPGLHLKVPVIDTTVNVSVRDHTSTFDKVESYSADQQPADIRISVTYRVPDARVGDLYSQYGSLDNLQNRVLMPRTYDQIKKVFGRFTAVSAIQDRAKLGVDVTSSIREALRDEPVTIVGVQLEDISFSKTYVQSIEQRMLAQVQIETTRQQKETATINAEIQVVQAQAEADAKRAGYKAEADGITLRGEAEAKAIEARAKALAANTNLVQLNAVDKWDGKLPTTQLPGAALPFIGVK
ncbi:MULTISPECIES: prohibitin family protein [unclassified Achromobacter]|uniref:prohibitin family protein n=1 Tax=unclassified Achromobacter TaxID=2626865 RepID=UPI000B51DB1E|nr:Band 7 protein [Achromobacter sp. HZ28]OWT77959.1 Band 7 protein [Achromobacter sp. HZ34]